MRFVRSTAQLTPGYMSGFGNSFETEALPGALPMGRNSPQRCAYGLYARTTLRLAVHRAARQQMERSWLYRIRPSVKHSGRFARADAGLWRTAPCHEYTADRATALGSGADPKGGHDLSRRACRP